MTNVNLVGIAASICTAASLLPQLYKTIKEKKAESISFAMMAVLFTGIGLWVYYGCLQKDLIIIISNSFSGIFNLLLIYFVLKYKK